MATNFLKGTKIYSMYTGTCPVCQNESMYKEKNPYKIASIFKMYERCSHCNTKYKIEPSFFFGAMYVSYALGVGISIATFIICFLVLELDLLVSFYIITGVLVVLFPPILRLSRSIWINFFLHYDKKKVSK